VISHSAQNNKILRLIESVYDVALDERRWSALAPRIARAFDSTSATLMVQEAGRPRILTMTENVSAGMNSYRQYYWGRDVWVQRGIKLGISQVGASQDLITDAEFQETEFYRDWCRQMDVFYVVGSVFSIGQEQLGVLGIHRPRSSGTYVDEHKSRVSRFLPHIQRALQIRNRLEQATFLQRVSLENLNRTDTATIVVAPDGYILFANSQAEALFAHSGAVNVHNGRLGAANQSDTARLLSLIRSASNMGEARNEPGGVMALRKVNALPLSVLVAPFRAALPGLPPPGAIVFIRDPNRSISAAAALQALFQLTPAEARIAEALANGKSLAEIAVSQRANRQTVRKQLKAIFAKTGTNRQAQCVAAILRSIAAIARD
jgi:DNA-binding CsgD family transcriptional regulator/PAS domain-containing protein